MDDDLKPGSKHRCANCKGGLIPGCTVPGCVKGTVTIPEDETGRDAHPTIGDEPEAGPSMGAALADSVMAEDREPGHWKRRYLRPGEGDAHVSY